MFSLIGLAAMFVAVPPACPTVRIVIELSGLSTPVTSFAIEEAAALWEPYGVAIVTTEAAMTWSHCDLAIDARLTARIADTANETQAWSVPFGAVGFTPEGIPGSTILIYRALTGLGTVEIEGVHARQWPTSLRNRVLGRMIGRVLAHEIGHWVLR